MLTLREEAAIITNKSNEIALAAIEKIDPTELTERKSFEVGKDAVVQYYNDIIADAPELAIRGVAYGSIVAVKKLELDVVAIIDDKELAESALARITNFAAAEDKIYSKFSEEAACYLFANIGRYTDRFVKNKDNVRIFFGKIYPNELEAFDEYTELLFG